jgi:phosphatidylglycerol lysyltransferase
LRSIYISLPALEKRAILETSLLLSLSEDVLTVPPDRIRSRFLSRADVILVWLVGHGARAWPFVVFAVVLGLSWEALRQIRPQEFRVALYGLDQRWLLTAAALTALNIGAMGLYDVIAFSHTRSRSSERWRYGAVAFAWSNFLTLGPLAGPAMRFWLYRPAVDQVSDLHDGIVAVATAFTSGLIGWTVAVLIGGRVGANPLELAVIALILCVVAVWIARVGIASVARRLRPTLARNAGSRVALDLAVIGWTDWLLAALVFVACLKAAGAVASVSDLATSFFLGQVLGVVSLVPGGFGSSDAFWIAHLPLPQSQAAAVLAAYRLTYYVIPWAVASLLLLSWVTQRAPRRLEIARRVVAGLVGGGGVLIMLSSASPALYARLPLLERFIPLPLVETGHVAAALAGLLLLVLARGLGRGYRAAFRLTLVLLTIAGCGAILKGLDWEEAVVLSGLAIATWSQSALFDRPSRGDPWIEGPDLVIAFAALTLFFVFGALSHRVSGNTLARLTTIGYRVQAPRFLRTAVSMGLAVGAGSMYVLMRSPVRFNKLRRDDIDQTLALHGRIGTGTNPLMVAVGDKAVFLDGERGFCLYRTIGPYLVVFSDPVVRSLGERAAFLDALFAFAGELDRRPAFYQMSLDWIPVLHDRGYDFFKLGEEARVRLPSVTLEGHAGKMYRQILRRAERDGLRFRIMPPDEVDRHLPELRAISADWLQAKDLAERQFSIGYFDDEYLRRFPCAVVEQIAEPCRVMGFANLLEGPDRQELSVDLMRYRSDGPSVMDFLIVSLLLHGKAQGYREFNLGMAPLSSVGEQRGAHARERLARLLFQRGEQWYNFQGLRFYKDKFSPEWVPRYMAYQDAWEWPVAIAYVSALIAGGWTSIFYGARESARPA